MDINLSYKAKILETSTLFCWETEQQSESASNKIKLFEAIV